jgi:serine/threonine-protein kinase RsbW
MKQTQHFPRRSESVSEARRFVRDVLADRPSEARDSIELMVSELATNCIRHAHSAFDVTLQTTRRTVRVEVCDSQPGRPEPQSPSPNEPTGRGLRIVEALSDTWGVEPSPGGKIVWFEIKRVDAPKEETRTRLGCHGKPHTSSRRDQADVQA